MRLQLSSTPRVSFRLIATVFAMAAIGAACGGGEQPAAESSAASAAPAQAGSTDPCALVTAAEAEAALGGTVGAPERPREANIPPALTTCRYVAPRGQGVAVLVVMVRRSRSAAEAQTGFRTTREVMPGAETVTGVGDQAFWVADGLHVLKGTTYVSFTGNVDRDAARKLADAALPRLQ